MIAAIASPIKSLIMLTQSQKLRLVPRWKHSEVERLQESIDSFLSRWLAREKLIVFYLFGALLVADVFPATARAEEFLILR